MTASSLIFNLCFIYCTFGQVINNRDLIERFEEIDMDLVNSSSFNVVPSFPEVDDRNADDNTCLRPTFKIRFRYYYDHHFKNYHGNDYKNRLYAMTYEAMDILKLPGLPMIIELEARAVGPIAGTFRVVQNHLNHFKTQTPNFILNDDAVIYVTYLQDETHWRGMAVKGGLCSEDKGDRTALMAYTYDDKDSGVILAQVIAELLGVSNDYVRTFTQHFQEDDKYTKTRDDDREGKCRRNSNVMDTGYWNSDGNGIFYNGKEQWSTCSAKDLLVNYYKYVLSHRGWCLQRL